MRDRPVAARDDRGGEGALTTAQRIITKNDVLISHQAVNLPDVLPLSARNAEVKIRYTVDVSPCAASQSTSLYLYRVGAPFIASVHGQKLTSSLPYVGLRDSFIMQTGGWFSHNGRVPVVASGSFGDSFEDKAEFSKKIYHTGISAVIMITSHFAKQEDSDDVLIGNFDKFFQMTGNIPMGTYECPSPYKRILSPYVFKYLLGTNRMKYHKDTTIIFEKVKEKIELVGKNKLEFYDACIANTMYSLQAGAKGMSAISGNLYPEIIVWMCNNSTNPGRQEDVKYIQQQLTKTEDILAQNYPLSAKYFLHKRGLPIEVISRINTVPLTLQQTVALDDTYKVFLGWCDRLGIKPAHT